jgi:hypothetical protein
MASLALVPVCNNAKICYEVLVAAKAEATKTINNAAFISF